VGGEVGAVDSRSAALAGGIGSGAQALEGAVDVVEHLGGLRQFGFVPLFHEGQSTAIATGATSTPASYTL